jgi:phage shock protein PspC (stress-responsive transcriptional regulator)
MCGGERRTIVSAMTETLFGPPPPPPPPPDERKLVRSPDDKVVAGVCAAFGRYTDTDPVLWRVTVAVLTLFGGAGLALYALGWLLVPETGQSKSLAERTLRRPDNGLTVAGIVLLVVGGIVLIGLLDNGPGLPALLVIGGLAFLVARERREHPVAPAAWQPPPTTVPYGPPPSWSGPPEGWVPPPPPVRERSPLGLVTLSVAAVLAGLLLALSIAGVDGLTAPRILAVALLVVGAGLLLGSWFGRARWLIAIGLVLTVGLAATATAERLQLDEGLGQRTWVASAGSSEYALGAGEGILDLRALEPGDRAQISARIGMGSLVVLVPEGLSVRVNSAVDLGEISRPEDDALDRDRRQDGTRLRESFVVGDGPTTVELDLTVRLGEIAVSHASS